MATTDRNCFVVKVQTSHEISHRKNNIRELNRWHKCNQHKVDRKILILFFNTSFLVQYLRYTFVAKIFLQIVSRRRARVTKTNSFVICCRTNLLQEKNKHVICRLRVGPYSEKLWPRAWKCCPGPAASGSIFKPSVTVFHRRQISIVQFDL